MSSKNINQRFNNNAVSVVVVGSINLDLSSFVETFPVRNQTIAAHESNISAGGKGLNQAIAAARTGAKVSFVGCVGNDAAGAAAMKVLEDNGVDTTFVKVVDHVHTGTANILVADGGDNMIAVSPGANHQLTTSDVANATERIETADVMLCQLECSLAVVDFAMQVADTHNVSKILNPAPVVDGVLDLIHFADYITPNETEALDLTNFDPLDTPFRQLAADKLRGMGASNAVITLGSLGSFIAGVDGHSHMLAPFSVEAINTTGAGDTFNGAFACGIARGYELVDAAIYASAASAISVTGKSAYDSAPRHHDIIDFINSQPRVSKLLQSLN